LNSFLPLTNFLLNGKITQENAIMKTCPRKKSGGQSSCFLAFIFPFERKLASGRNEFKCLKARANRLACSFEVTTLASRWRSWRLARTDAIAKWRPVQARIPHLEVRGKVAYAWLGRILEGGAKNVVLLSRVGIFILSSRHAAVTPLLLPCLR
jgi:hypothetical protein